MAYLFRGWWFLSVGEIHGLGFNSLGGYAMAGHLRGYNLRDFRAESSGCIGLS